MTRDDGVPREHGHEQEREQDLDRDLDQEAESDETILVRRAGSAEPDENPLDETVVVERASAAEPDDDPLDETVAVEQAAPVPARDEEPGALDDLDETIIVRRETSTSVPPIAAPAASAEAAEPARPDDHVEPTVTVEPTVEDTSAGLEALDETVVVERVVPPREDPSPRDVEPPVTPRIAFAERPLLDAVEAERTTERDLDDTVVTPRPALEPALDRTRVVDHDDDPIDATRVVQRQTGDESDESDDTIIVRRTAARALDDPSPASPSPSSPSPASPARAQLPPTRRSLRAQRTPITLPSGTAASERAAAALGADAVVRYEPRPVPAPPEPGPDLGSGPEATRAEAPSMRSVRRASRSAGWIAVGSIAGACVVSVVGLVVIVSTLVGA